MPNPEDYDDKDSFISDCVSEKMDEGKNQEDALGACYGIWEDQAEATDESFRDYLSGDADLDDIVENDKVEATLNNQLVVADTILDALNDQGISQRNISVQFREEPKLIVNDTDLDVRQLDSELSPFWTAEIRNNKVEIKPQ